MAILRGPYGTGFVKRLGSVVGQKAGNGKYKVYAYQPDVTNPRTDAQLIQRAKFTFVTQLAAIFTDAGIIGLERQPYTTLRTAFASINLPKVKVNTLIEPNEVDVYATMAEMRVSMGLEPSPHILLQRFKRGELSCDFRTNVPNGSLPPDEVIVVVCVPKVFGTPDYNAQVVRLTPTQIGSGEGYKIYSAGFFDLNVIAPGIDWTENTPFASIYAYNLRYDGNKRGYDTSAMSGDQENNENVAHLEQTMRLQYARHLYSPSTYAEIMNDIRP